MVDGPGALSGRTLGGYRLGARLASSPHAEVYRATDDELDREVVIKLVPAGAAGAAARERFVAEARVAARIDHPYATHVYGSGVEADGTCWMAMEWVRGATLAERVARHGPLRVDEAVELAGRLAEVVSTLHDQGLVHLDLKPDNILVVARGGRLLPRLCDFGLAAVPLDGPAGTPAYMAPEQWRLGEAGAPAVGPRADVYALAACVHFALTGAHAFGGDGVATIAAAHAREPRPRLPPSFPSALAEVIAGALAIEPGTRPASALELAAALRGAIDVRARPRFDDAVVEAVLAGAPEPIAEAMAAWEAAPSERAAREALDELQLTTARWLGLCALALRRAHGIPPAGTAPRAVAEGALATLATGSPSPTAWLALARDDAPVAPLAAELDRAARLTQATEEAGARELQLTARLVAVQRLLRAAAPVIAPRLVVRRGARVERWSGVRRRKRPAIWVATPAAIAEGVPTLVDDEGAPLVALDGLAMIDAPAAGEPDELFVLAAGDGDASIFAAAPGYQRRIAGAPLGLAGDVAARDAREERGPYPGLMPFTADDAAWFVGREREVEDVANRLRDRPLLVVVGPSGVGKSSFALAGVAPATGARHVVVCRPGEAPLAALATALAAPRPELDAIAGRAEVLAAGGRVLVVIDQLEEVATRASAAEARAFGEAIVALAAIGDVRVLATVRDDFLVRVATATGLGGRLASGVVLLGPPDEAAMRRIVSEPAARVGYGFDDAELPAAMVAAVAGAASPLPLLSFAARALWSRRDRTRKQLRRRDHDAIGGVVGALARHADETVDALAPDARALVRPLLAALATAEGARVPVARAELVALLGGGAAAAMVIERLVDARLLVSREPDEIELVHEALLAAWPRLAAWRRDDALAAQLRDAIRSAAQQWEARGRRRELLWRGEALDELRVWRRKHRVRLTPRDEAFSAASLREARRRQLLLRGALVGGALAAALALVVLVRANREARAQRSAASAASAQAERRLVDAWIEQGRVAALEDRPREALAWLDAAAEASGAAGDARLARLIATAAAALGEDHVVTTFTAPVHIMAWSRSGKLLAAGGGAADARVVVLDRAGRRVATLPAGSGNVTAVAFSPDDRLLAVVTGGAARVWDLERDTALVTLPGKAIRARWSPDGTRLATAGGDGIVRIVRGLDGAVPASDRAVAATVVEIPARGNHGGAVTVDWLDDRRVVVGDREGWLRVHAASGGPAVAEHRAARPVLDVRADPGGVITLPFNSEIAERWEPDRGRAFPLAGHALAIDAVDASADGDVLATAGADGTLMIWQGRDGRLARTLTGHRGGIGAIAFIDDDVISGGSDGTLRIWRPSATVVRAAHASPITTVAATADGLVASGDSEGGVALWTAADLTGPETLPAAGVTSVIVDGDRWIAVAPGRVTELRPTPRALPALPAPTGVEGPLQVSYRRAGDIAADGTLALPDAHDAVALERAGTIRTRCPLGAPVSHTAISRDGRWLAAAGPSGALVACHAGTPTSFASAHAAAVWSLAFSPGGETLASTGADGVVRLLALANGEVRLATLEAGATSLAWLPDGSAVVAATLDGDLALVEPEGRIARTMRGTGVLVNAIAAVDERTVAVGYGDGIVALVDTELGRVARWTVGGAITWLAVAGPRLIAVHAGGVVALDLGAPLSREARRALVRCRAQLEMAGGGLRRAPRRCP